MRTAPRLEATPPAAPVAPGDGSAAPAPAALGSDEAPGEDPDHAPSVGCRAGDWEGGRTAAATDDPRLRALCLAAADYFDAWEAGQAEIARRGLPG